MASSLKWNVLSSTAMIATATANLYFDAVGAADDGPSVAHAARRLKHHLSKKLKIVIIVCAVVGGTAVLIGVCLLVYYFVRHRRNAAFVAVAQAVESTDSNNVGDVEATVVVAASKGGTVATPPSTTLTATTLTATRPDRKGRHAAATASVPYATPVPAAQRTEQRARGSKAQRPPQYTTKASGANSKHHSSF